MIVNNGATDVSMYFVLRDATTHAPKTDVTVTDIDLYYVEERAAISAKTDCTALAAADSAHTDGGAFNVGQGMYRIDWPDAAFDGGVGKRVNLIVVCTGVDTTFFEVTLSPAVNVTTWAGVATTSNERDAMNRLYDMIGTGLGQRYFNSMALQQVKNSIGLAAANLDTQLSTIDGIVDALALVAPDNQPIVNADGETLAYMTALSEEEIAAAVIVALQETPVEVICVTPQPSQESDYDILRNNATNC